MAMRDSADIGSPCEPVHRHSTSWLGIGADLGVANLDAGRDVQIAQPLRGLRVLDHAAADKRHLAFELRREIHEDLHPIDARRERRHDDAARRAREDLLECVHDFAFRAGEPPAVDVGAVGEERQHALRAEFGEAMHVEMLAVDRRLVDLEVARMDQRSDRRVNRQRHAVGHAVRHADELDFERADRHAVARPDRNQAMRAVEPVLLSLGSMNASVSGVA